VSPRQTPDAVTRIGAEAWDADAFAAMYGRHERTVAGCVMRRTRRAEISADVTSEVLAAALLAWRQGPVREVHERAWLLSIAEHKLIDSYRRGRVEDAARRRLAMRPTIIDDESLRAIEALTEETPALELVGSLPTEQQAVITGHVIEDRSYSELAAQLGCSEQVVRKRVSRALGSLRARIGGKR
jgi:RNA polymerase sigma factor (sigma-70 family)